MQVSEEHTMWGEAFGVVCWLWVFHRARHGTFFRAATDNDVARGGTSIIYFVRSPQQFHTAAASFTQTISRPPRPDGIPTSVGARGGSVRSCARGTRAREGTTGTQRRGVKGRLPQLVRSMSNASDRRTLENKRTNQELIISLRGRFNDTTIK